MNDLCTIMEDAMGFYADKAHVYKNHPKEKSYKKMYDVSMRLLEKLLKMKGGL